MKLFQVDAIWLRVVRTTRWRIRISQWQTGVDRCHERTCGKGKIVFIDLSTCLSSSSVCLTICQCVGHMSVQIGGHYLSLKNAWNFFQRADIAVGAIQVMAEREAVVDFSVPYYDMVGTTILMQLPNVPTSLFKFLSVLDDTVWGCIVAAYFVTR